MPVPTPLTFAPNAALLIDFDNVTMGIRSDLQTELKTLLASDIIKGKVQLRRAYADWRRYPQYVAPLAESSIDMIMAPAYGSSKKNATDIRLAIDALELVFTRPEIGTYILLSGDSDFSTLVIKLKEYGKYVIGVGIRESSSDLLVMNCDEYYSYNALAGLVRSSAEDEAGGGVRRDPWELVSEAIGRMVRNGDVMRADRLKQVMQDIDSTFDEKNLGMSKFSRFVQEAAQRGLISLSKMENGQLEVGPVQPGQAAAEGVPAQAPPASAPDDRASSGEAKAHGERAEERGRRGRRGGRGRGREVRGARASAPVADTSTDAAAPATAVAPVVESAVAERHDDGAAMGASGERLTRDEAFDLVRRAVLALQHGDEAVRASDIRGKAFEILGRESESLSERNFARILRDAHDADVIDLRRRGDDYEVVPATSATPVAQQLNAAAAATRAAAPAPASTTSGPPAPRGLGVRGVRRGGLHARPAAPPAELLSVGIVDVRPGAVSAAPEPSGEPAHPSDQAVELVPHAESRSPTASATASAAAELEDAAAEVAPRAGRRGTAAKRPRARAKRASPAASEPTTRSKRGTGRGRAGSKSTDQ